MFHQSSPPENSHRWRRTAFGLHISVVCTLIFATRRRGISFGWVAFLVIAMQNLMLLMANKARRRVQAISQRHRLSLLLDLARSSVERGGSGAEACARMENYYLRIGGPRLHTSVFDKLPVIHDEWHSRCAQQRTYLGLRGHCFWRLDDLGPEIAKGIHQLEALWLELRDEARALLPADFRKDAVYEEHSGAGEWAVGETEGEWSYIHLYDSKASTGRGICRFDHNCALLPATSAAVEEFPRAMLGLVGLSRLAPGSHIPPHRGPMMGRLTLHMPLFGAEGVMVRVGGQRQAMVDGQVMVFDDTYQHEVWHRGGEARVSLMMDVFHPDLSQPECDVLRTLSDLSHTRSYCWLFGVHQTM